MHPVTRPGTDRFGLLGHTGVGRFQREITADSAEPSAALGDHLERQLEVLLIAGASHPDVSIDRRPKCQPGKTPRPQPEVFFSA